MKKEKYLELEGQNVLIRVVMYDNNEFESRKYSIYNYFAPFRISYIYEGDAYGDIFDDTGAIVGRFYCPQHYFNDTAAYFRTIWDDEGARKHEEFMQSIIENF